VVVCTAGMLEGGPVMYYLGEAYSDPRSRLLLTGYQVEDTNGRLALETGRVELDGRTVTLRCKLEQFDFSAHADQTGLLTMVERSLKAGCERVITMHGDRCPQMAEWVRQECGVDAHAPQNGEELTV